MPTMATHARFVELGIRGSAHVAESEHCLPRVQQTPNLQLTRIRSAQNQLAEPWRDSLDDVFAIRGARLLALVLFSLVQVLRQIIVVSHLFDRMQLRFEIVD